MPDAPPMPRRPYKRKEPKQTPAEVQDACIMLTTKEKSCALLLNEMETPDYEVIAARLHLTVQDVMEIVDSAPMKLYLAKLQDKELTELARVRWRKFRKNGISRTAIEERLYDLMMLEPSETKGNIDGQVKAAAALADKFGYSKTEDPLAGKSPDELKAIVHKGHKLIEGSTVN